MHPASHPGLEPAPRPSGTARFAVEGMTCANCARHVGEAIRAVPGVADAEVSLEEGSAVVRWTSGTDPSVEAVVAAVKEAGYSATPDKDSKNDPGAPAESPMAAWKFTLVFGALLTVPLMAGEWIFGLGSEAWFKWIGFAFSAPVMIVCGRRFFKGAWEQLKRGRSNMDTLVALGSSTAFGYSLASLLMGWSGHAYFMEASAIITLISAGHYFEARVSARAADALRALMNLAPQTARKLDGDSEVETPVAALKPGDRILLKPGDRIPTDGEVLEGGSAVDESMLTGEPVPVDKAPGAKLYGGTVNQSGRLIMRVTATGESTALAQIIQVVRRAQTSRANIQKLGDQVSSVFVPVVVLVAAGTGLWWGLAYDHALEVARALEPWLWHAHFPDAALPAAFIHAAAVLIVACPCAMGLATPVAIMAGANAAARRGILIRDGIALEKSGTVTAILFDKTGTLTRGRLSVVAVEDLRTENERKPSLGQLARTLARPSNHPLSRAIATHAFNEPASETPALAGKQPQPGEWREIGGRGVEGVIQGQIHRLGSLNWLRELGTVASSGFIDRWMEEGATVLGLAADNRCIGLIALRDELKPGVSEVVRQLNEAGRIPHLVTGDQRRTALALARRIGIPDANVFAEVMPAEKADIVRRLQAQGLRVGFVGDGINDAPAIEQADLGIAVSQASDVAREAADILLLKSDVQAIPESLELAAATLRTIKQNLFWAFFYNAAAVPLAATGFLSPVICALAMGLSDLIIIGNALRLNRYAVRRPLSTRPETAS